MLGFAAASIIDWISAGWDGNLEGQVSSANPKPKPDPKPDLKPNSNPHRTLKSLLKLSFPVFPSFHLASFDSSCCSSILLLVSGLVGNLGGPSVGSRWALGRLSVGTLGGLFTFS